MFEGCYSLSNIYPLENWNASNWINFGEMFRGCIELESITGLKNWNVSNWKCFRGMLGQCLKLKNLKGLKKSDVSNGYNFDYMFLACIELKYDDKKLLEKLNYLNKEYYKDIFKEYKYSNFIKDVIVKKPPPKKTELSSENSKSGSEQSFLFPKGELIFDF